MYLALERCARTLYDAVMVPLAAHALPEDSDEEEELADADLWQIARDTVEGVHVRPFLFQVVARVHFALCPG